ncbi:MAG: hypothetical protein ABJB47_11920, partial [Actinomycetota bacterium]
FPAIRLAQGKIRRLNAMTETVPGPSRPGSVVLNVGPGIGALVLHVPAELDGHEIEISHQDLPPGHHRTHSQVRERRVGSHVQYAAVYPDLPPGEYTLWRDATTPAGIVKIGSGEVTSHEWPA